MKRLREVINILTIFFFSCRLVVYKSLITIPNKWIARALLPQTNVVDRSSHRRGRLPVSLASAGPSPLLAARGCVAWVLAFG
jgi:hypothetical protein